jgi:hypothetical protein
MSVGQDDLLQSINTVWDASSLDVAFKALWTATPDGDDFPVLHDAEAGGEQPWPYCVFESQPGTVVARMSKGNDDLWMIRDEPSMFKIHACEVDGDSRTAKQIAAYLAEEVMKVFGGHPTVAPESMTLDNGDHLVTLFQNDYSMREGDSCWMWTVSYIFRIDVPEMA